MCHPRIEWLAHPDGCVDVNLNEIGQATGCKVGGVHVPGSSQFDQIMAFLAQFWGQDPAIEKAQERGCINATHVDAPARNISTKATCTHKNVFCPIASSPKVSSPK